MDEEIDFERFGEDIFTWLWLEFRFLPQRVPDAKRKPNIYNSVPVLRSVVRAVNLNQILCREMFNKFFEAELVRLESLLDTKENLLVFIIVVIESVFQKCEKGKTYDVFTKVIQSFTVPTEIVLFLESKGLRTYIENIPGFWYQFFTCRLSVEFKEKGGLKMLEEKCDKTSNVAPYLKRFISSHCLPYSGENLYEKYRYFVANWKQPSGIKIEKKTKVLETTPEKNKDFKNITGNRWTLHPWFSLFTDKSEIADDKVKKSEKSKTSLEKTRSGCFSEEEMTRKRTKKKKEHLLSNEISVIPGTSRSSEMHDIVSKESLEPEMALQGMVKNELPVNNTKSFQCSTNIRKGKSKEKNISVPIPVKSSDEGKEMSAKQDDQLPKSSLAQSEESLQRKENYPELNTGEYQNKHDFTFTTWKLLENESRLESKKLKTNNRHKKTKKKKKSKSQIKDCVRSSKQETLLHEDSPSKENKLSNKLTSKVDDNLDTIKTNDGNSDAKNSSMSKVGTVRHQGRQDKSPEDDATPGSSPYEFYTVKYSEIAKLGSAMEKFFIKTAEDSSTELKISDQTSVKANSKTKTDNPVPQSVRSIDSVLGGEGQTRDMRRIRRAVRRLKGIDHTGSVSRMSRKNESFIEEGNDSVAKKRHSHTEARQSPESVQSVRQQSPVFNIEEEVQKLYISTEEINWRKASYDRFAEDIYSTLCKQFKIPARFFHNTGNKPVLYTPDDFIEVAAEALLFIQIITRKLLFEHFTSAWNKGFKFQESPILSGFAILHAIDKLVVKLWEPDEYEIFSRVIHSLTVPIELILFLASKGIETHTEYFPTFWKVSFTCNLLKDFERIGGMWTFYNMCNQANIGRPFIKAFVDEKCQLYNGEDLYPRYEKWVKEKEERFYQNYKFTPIQKN